MRFESGGSLPCGKHAKRGEERRLHAAGTRPAHASASEELPMKPKAVFSVIVGAAALVAGCSSSFPPPNDQWAAAQGDVGRAQTGGAASVPDARLHLQLAEEDLQKAKALIGNDNQRAATLTEVARTEAQLALSLGKQAEADAQARQAQDQLAKFSAK
jgi:hypothetical protein